MDSPKKPEFDLQQHISTLAHSLPKCKYLENKILQVEFVREYFYAPKGNCDVVPENFASGLPSFLSKSTLKTNKSVIFFSLS